MTQGVRGEVWLRSATERCKRYQIPVFASPSPQGCGWELLQRVVRVFRSLQEIKADELRFGLLLSLFPPALMSDCLRNCRELWRLPNYLPISICAIATGKGLPARPWEPCLICPGQAATSVVGKKWCLNWRHRSEPYEMMHSFMCIHSTTPTFHLLSSRDIRSRGEAAGVVRRG